MAIGRSFQPNLLTRGSTDQAIITGASSAIAYQAYSAGDALVTSVASRLGRSDEPNASRRLAVAGVAGAVSAGAAFALRVARARTRPESNRAPSRTDTWADRWSQCGGNCGFARSAKWPRLAACRCSDGGRAWFLGDNATVGSQSLVRRPMVKLQRRSSSRGSSSLKTKFGK